MAERVVLRIRAAFRFLAGAPGAGHAREDLTGASEVRFWPVFSFLIASALDRRPLGILRIVHGARDPRGVEDRLRAADGEEEDST